MEAYPSSFSERLLYFFTLAFVSTLLFIIFTQPEIDNALRTAIPDPAYRYLATVLLFFIFVYLADRLLQQLQAAQFKR